MAFLQGNLTLFMIGRSLLLHLPHSSFFFFAGCTYFTLLY
jgi:hypothetical protein